MTKPLRLSRSGGAITGKMRRRMIVMTAPQQRQSSLGRSVWFTVAASVAVLTIFRRHTGPGRWRDTVKEHSKLDDPVGISQPLLSRSKYSPMQPFDFDGQLWRKLDGYAV